MVGFLRRVRAGGYFFSGRFQLAGGGGGGREKGREAYRKEIGDRLKLKGMAQLKLEMTKGERGSEVVGKEECSMNQCLVDLVGHIIFSWI